MYKLFTDKAELFECDIKIEGASLSNSTARLVVETNDYSLMFNGKISSNGKCQIPIRKLKGLIDESSKGNICKTETTACGIGIKPLPSVNDAVSEPSLTSVAVVVSFVLDLSTSACVISCLRYILSTPS